MKYFSLICIILTFFLLYQFSYIKHSYLLNHIRKLSIQMTLRKSPLALELGGIPKIPATEE
jgi:hypothetical protein